MNTLNINVGILGHVDSGKTSLSKVLSTVASTSAFDKNPQSKKRGITLDLGFSSFSVQSSAYPFSQSIRDAYQIIQYTLVDCPGHSSLIRTVLCGARIIDIMLLVVDVTKGFQTQTSECLLIGEIICEKMLVVLNKCDLLSEDKRNISIEKMKKKIRKTLEATKFKDVPIVAVSAAPGAVEAEFNPDVSNSSNREDIQKLIKLLSQTVLDPTEKRKKIAENNFLFAVDHCFAISGQGTVLTGTVLAGCTSIGQIIELPYQKTQKKIKSIQMFHKPVNSIGPGDRAGICVAQLDPNLLERGLVGDPSKDNLSLCHACILSCVNKIPYFKYPLKSKSRLHFFVGQETVLARLTFFACVGKNTTAGDSDDNNPVHVNNQITFNRSNAYEYLDQLTDDLDYKEHEIYLLLEFEHSIVCPMNSLIIGAKLDTFTIASCRLALYGQVCLQLNDSNYKQTILNDILIYRPKIRIGQIERIVNSRACIVKGLFKRETNWEIFVGLKAYIVYKPTDESGDNQAPNNHDNVTHKRFYGYIESSFGQSGKCRLALNDDLPSDILNVYSGKAGKMSQLPGAQNGANDYVQVVLEFKKHIFDSQKRIFQ